MNTKSEKEMFTRVAILDVYGHTTSYQDHYKRAKEKITALFTRHEMYLNGTTANKFTEEDFINDSDRIVQRLDEDSLVTHTLELVRLNGHERIIEFRLYIYREADYLPFEVKEKSNDSGFMTLRFDLNVGIDKQLKVAKQRLQEQRDIYKKSFQKGGKVQTSKYSLDNVLSHLECLATRDAEYIHSVRDLCKKLDMSVDTFNDKCNKALELIRTKEIIRFFPK